MQAVVFDKRKGAVNKTVQAVIDRMRAGEVADMCVSVVPWAELGSLG